MEPKWAPGPWAYVEEVSGGEFFGCGVAYHKDTQEFIWFDNCVEVETDIANAHLIAAAPDLYDALERCLNFIANTESEMGETLQSGDMARAALALARGEA